MPSLLQFATGPTPNLARSRPWPTPAVPVARRNGALGCAIARFTPGGDPVTMAYPQPGQFPDYPQYPGQGAMPAKPPIPKTVQNAFYLMLAGAALQLLGVVVGLASTSKIRDSIRTNNPGYTSTQVDTAVQASEGALV